ncbi:GtrA-like protein [bacterium BMS3Abin15]|nr:GtrA-like protein [bacterium BMS3Abin15]HDZ85957.1 GtrA family protein [Candidatus Moranbacteria bacterium]
MDNIKDFKISQSPPQIKRGGIKKLIKQFSKFVVVGVINTAIDFLVLNLEMVLTGITSGPYIFLFNSISFSVATVNSYFMNKHWTFQDQEKSHEAVKFSQFLAVSVVGISINGGVVYFITTFIEPFFGMDPLLWANIAKIVATGLSLIWNFIGYKLWVFKK